MAKSGATNDGSFEMVNLAKKRPWPQVQSSPSPDRGRRDLNRAQRRRLDRAVEGLMGKDGCTVCGAAFEHNSRIFGGCDLYGRPAITGDCCSERLALVTHGGINTKRSYDFLHPRKGKPRRNRSASATEITNAIETCRGLIEEADQALDDVERCAGVRGPGQVNVLETPWKTDDRLWFEVHPERSHRARLAFSGEADEQTAKVPAGHMLLMLVRQAAPGKRVRAGFYLNAALWPVPDDDAIAHALFDVATRQQAVPQGSAERAALVEKYRPSERVQ
jgi:hypothetical protein